MAASTTSHGTADLTMMRAFNGKSGGARYVGTIPFRSHRQRMTPSGGVKRLKAAQATAVEQRAR